MSKKDLSVKSGKLIPYIMDVSEHLSIEDFLLTIDIQKVFDFVNHSFLLAVLKAFDFGKDFLHWIEILITNQNSCVLNGGTTTKYFKLVKGTRQEDPISEYLFILVLEIVFLMIKTNQNIKPLNFFVMISFTLHM